MELDKGARPYVNMAVESALGEASPEVAGLWQRLQDLAVGDLPEMGLAAGLRPVADIQVLIGLVAAAESELARRLEAASRAGCLPLAGVGALPAAAGWARRTSVRVARCGSFAAQWPEVGRVWSAGVITAEHVDVLARCERLTEEEMAEVLEELWPLWAGLTPTGLARFLDRIVAMLHPPPDPQLDERDTYEARSVTWAVTGDAVVLSGLLPRAEGEVVVAALDAFAERLRDKSDATPAAARRADALVELVNAAHASGSLPMRGGLPVSLTVTLEETAAGDQVATTSRGRLLTDAELGFALCDACVTPVLVEAGCADVSSAASADSGCGVSPSVPGSGPAPGPADQLRRIRALARVLLGDRIPLAVGRTARTATPAQRRALAVRDRGCVIPGCGIPAEACQVHHVREWAAGGPTDLQNLVLLCWTHHRQVELGMWRLSPRTAQKAGEVPLPAPRPPFGGRAPTIDWQGNNGSPWVVTTQSRSRWRL